MNSSFKAWKAYTLLFLFIWLTSNFFPGSYNVDTWYQYFEMESWKFDDWHSPFLAILWKFLYLGSNRFFSLYIFQMAWYFLFFHLLTNQFTRKFVVGLGVAISLLLVFIPQYLMKDVHMTLSWCSALLLMLMNERNSRRFYMAGALLLITYGLLLRPNSLPAAWPLLLLWFDGFQFFKKRRLLKYLSTIISGVFIFIFYYIVLWSVLDAKPAYFTYKYRLADVTGISIMSGENFMPACITSFPKYDQKRVEEQFTPATNDNLYFWGDTIYPPPNAELDACVKEAWIKAVKKHPFVYLKCRAIGYIYYLKVVNRVPKDQYWNVMIYVVKNNYIPIDDHHTPLTKLMIKGWKKLDYIFFFDPWLWLLLNLILSVIFYRKYRRNKLQFHKLLFMLQLSCIIYQVAMFPFFQIDLDFRFSYLNLFGSITGLLFYLNERYSTKHETGDKVLQA